MVTEYLKDKHSLKVSEIVHLVPLINVDKLWHLIKGLCPHRLDVTYYRKIAEHIAPFCKVGVDAFNGGKNRTKHYFPMYYFPMKVLESQGKILYGGRGKVQRLKP